jgi:hypothetical protein
MLDTTKLYSFQGQEPQILPQEIILSDGKSRTDSSTFTEEEIIDAGFSGPYEKPQFNEDIETLEWNSELKDWVIEPISEEFFWEVLRKERDLKLKESDWTQLLDSPLSESLRNSWANYRQELRDLPQNTSNPATTILPTQPE